MSYEIATLPPEMQRRTVCQFRCGVYIGLRCDYAERRPTQQQRQETKHPDDA